MRVFYLGIVGIFSLVMFVSCKSCINNNKALQNKEKQENENFLNDTANKTTEIKTVITRFPSPGEMFGLIKEGGLTFEEKLLNTTDRLDNYNKFKDQSLNLGIYIADFAYISIFGRQDKAVSYLKLIENLSKKVGISAALDEELISKIKKNINSIDSLTNYSDEAFIDIFDYCETNKIQYTNVLLSAGAYIEGLYIALNNLKNYSDENPVLIQLASQKQSFGHVLAYAETYKENPSVKEIIPYLIQIDDIFKTLKAEVKKTSVTKTKENNLVFSGGKKYIFTKEVFDNLKAKVTIVREQIVNSKI